MTPLLEKMKSDGIKKLFPPKARIAVGLGTCGIGNGADVVYKAFEKEIKKKKLNICLKKTGCFGFCSKETLVNVNLPGKPILIFEKVTPEDVKKILAYVATGKVPATGVLCKIEDWDFLADTHVFGKDYPQVPLWNEVPFFKWQKKIVMRNTGLIDPEDIEEALAVGGYSALQKALTQMDPAGVIDQVTKSKLRGRGGAGFPTGIKWGMMAKAPAGEKYIICNADEGDPGAYMNRNVIESDPHALLEGMIIGAYAMGVSRGVIYVRAEYPLAVDRITLAIAQAKKAGLLGNNILGSSFSFDIDIVEGAGAFVCGEETALIASLESEAGRPRPRPPFPAEKGFRGKPTNINNVETWYNIPVIINKGADWFVGTGTEKSPGTKVFSLVGKVKNTGLAELPLGTPFKTLIYNIGGGTGTKKAVKAVQSGGPSGGCIAPDNFETPIDYESFAALGAIMGSGGMVVMDDDNCMVDVARYFTEVTTAESCGKCTPCREGLFQSLRMIKDITQGKANEETLNELKVLANVIKDTALCGLGQTAPNPVLTTLMRFRGEYLEHIKSKRCAAGVCQDLFVSQCENSCPLHINMPGFLELVKEGRTLEAYELILNYNPLPSSTGRICHFHCKMRCRREDIDEPVSQGEAHRYVADAVYKSKKDRAVIQKIIKSKLPDTGKKIAIIGGGPTGLTAAFYLARLGHYVVVHEAQAEAGGVLRYGIPEYRLPKAVLQKEIANIKAVGVKILCNKKIGAQDIIRIVKEYDAVFVASGSYKQKALGIPGESLNGVVSGVEYLKDVASGKTPKLKKEVLIVGAGNVAIDAARTVLRGGSRVTVVYRRAKEDMPANKDEIFEAQNEGVGFVFMAAPKEVLGDAAGKVKALRIEKMSSGEYDLSGRKKPAATGQFMDIPCDNVLVAIGEGVESDFLRQAGIEVNKSGTVKVDTFTLRTSIAGVYAGGDLVTGPATAVEAMAYGNRVAEIIDLHVMGRKRQHGFFKTTIIYGNDVPLKPFAARKQEGKRLAVKQRKGNFKEVSLGLTLAQARTEALRCLRCDVKGSCAAGMERSNA